MALVFTYKHTYIVSLCKEHDKAGLTTIHQHSLTIFKYIVSTTQVFTTFIVLPRVSTTLKEVYNTKECTSHAHAQYNLERVRLHFTNGHAWLLGLLT